MNFQGKQVIRISWRLIVLALSSLAFINCAQMESARTPRPSTSSRIESTGAFNTQALGVNQPKIDTLNYFISKNLNVGLRSGTHALSQTVIGNEAWSVKWQSDSFEYFTWDDENIYLKEDHSLAPNPAYSFNSGIWLKRSMFVGEQIFASGTAMTAYDKACNKTGQSTFPYVMTLEAHHPNYDLGGDLGRQDIIVVRFSYGGGAMYEKFYYSSQWGWVKWEWYKASSEGVY